MGHADESGGSGSEQWGVDTRVEELARLVAQYLNLTNARSHLQGPHNVVEHRSCYNCSQQGYISSYCHAECRSSHGMPQRQLQQIRVGAPLGAQGTGQPQRSGTVRNVSWFGGGLQAPSGGDQARGKVHEQRQGDYSLVWPVALLYSQ